MFAGKVFEAQRLQYRCRSNGSGFAVSGMFPIKLAHGASLATFFTPDYLGTAPGFSMTVQSSRWATTGVTQPNENPQTSASLAFPAIATDTTVSRVYWSEDCDAVLDFTDVALYMNHNANWELHIGQIEWRLNDELLGSWGGLTLYSSMVPTPMAIPVMPGAVNISASAIVTLGEPTGIPLPCHTEAEMISTAHVGFRYLQNGVWQSPPVAFPEPFGPPPAPYGLDDILLGGDMWDGVIRCRNYKLWDYTYTGQREGYDTYRYDNISETSNASATIIPDLPKGVARLNDDYAAVVLRGGFPETFAEGRLVDLVYRPEYAGTFPPWTVTEERQVHAPYTQMLSTVTNDEHVIEEPLTQQTFSPCDINRTYFDFTRWNELVVPIGSTEWWWTGGPPMPPWAGSPQVTRQNGAAYYTFPSRVTRSQTLSYLSHAVDQVEYLNTWANPHWSYLLWFPPEDASPSVQWLIDGSPATPQEYWLNARQQHLEHPALPANERLKVRNNIVTEPLWQNGLAGLMLEAVLGQVTSWWGVSRFNAQVVAPEAAVVYDAESAPAWSMEDDDTGELIISPEGVIVQLNPGQTAAKVRLDIGRFTEFPWMLPHVATRIRTDWDGEKVVSGKVRQVGVDGSKVTLAAEPGLAQLKARGGSRKYAGTWAQDFGVSFIDDVGLDIWEPGTRSLSVPTMTNPERVFSFGLLPARGFDELAFEITVAPEDDPEATPAPVTIRWPVLLNAWGIDDVRIIQEAPMFQSVLIRNGPWWRSGVWQFYDPFVGFMNPPAVNPAFGMPTAGDWLCSRRLIFDGTFPLDLGAIEAEMATLYDRDIEWTQVKHLWSDPFTQAPVTHSWLMKGEHSLLGCMVNSFSEVPPLAGFPNRERNGDFQFVDGTHDQRAYSLITSKQYVVHANRANGAVNRLLKPPVDPENNRLVADPSLPEGYAGGWHLEEVDGSEQAQWRIRLASKGDPNRDYARVRPWHGYVWVPDTADETKRGQFGIKLTRDPKLGFVHAVLPAGAGGITLQSWDQSAGVARSRMVTTDESTCAAIAWSQHTRQLAVVYDIRDETQAGTIYKTTTDSQGIRWSNPEMLWEGVGAANAFDHAGREYVSYWQDGAFRLRYRKWEGQPWQGPFTIASSDIEGTTGIEVAPWANAPLTVVTSVQLEDDTFEVHRYESYSAGRVWAEVT